jgi:hypothetical protein
MKSKMKEALRMELDNKTNYYVLIHNPDIYFLSRASDLPFKMINLVSSGGKMIPLYDISVVEHINLIAYPDRATLTRHRPLPRASKNLSQKLLAAGCPGIVGLTRSGPSAIP